MKPERIGASSLSALYVRLLLRFGPMRRVTAATQVRMSDERGTVATWVSKGV